MVHEVEPAILGDAVRRELDRLRMLEAEAADGRDGQAADAWHGRTMLPDDDVRDGECRRRLDVVDIEDEDGLDPLDPSRQPWL